jgi:adenylate cyclase
MPARLTVKNLHTGEEFEYELTLPETRIGRVRDFNDLVLEDERVSRRHAVLRQSGLLHILIDLDSANGTLVNNEYVKDHTLSDGDEISISDYSLLYDHDVTPSVQFDNRRLGSTIMMRSLDDLIPMMPAIDRSLAASLSAPKALLDDLEALRKRAETLGHLYELNTVLNSVFSLRDIFKKVNEIIFDLTPADRFFVLLRNAPDQELSPFMAEFRYMNQGDAISRTVVERVQTEKIALVSTDAQSDQRLAGAKSLIVQNVHSVMCAPLVIDGAVNGVIYADCHDPLKEFSSDDLDLLNAVAAAASMAFDNATKHDQLLKEALARATYGRFMPPHVVDQILSSPGSLSLGGVNQVVTTLFSDVRGFTSLAESLPPETVVEILNEYFASAAPLVFKHGGILDKFIGDGLMALFGVPYEQSDSAARAVQAAAALQQEMIKLNEKLKTKGLPEITIGIGINTGNVVVGYIGSEQRTDYTAIGDAVNLAARLEKRAAPWQILISSPTHLACGDHFKIKPFGQIQVKGKAEPVEVYEVLWRGDENPDLDLPPTS